MMSYQQQRGFTLLEVLIALAVLAIAMSAIMHSTSTGAANAAYLTEKTLAHWVAMNKLAETQLLGEWPSAGIKKGDYEMANSEWRWEVKVSETDDEDVRRLDVSVYGGDRGDNALATLVAYLGKPMAAGSANP